MGNILWGCKELDTTERLNNNKAGRSRISWSEEPSAPRARELVSWSPLTS